MSSDATPPVHSNNSVAAEAGDAPGAADAADAPGAVVGPGAPVVITMGDACGIGPEIVAQLFRDDPAAARNCVVIGDLAVLRRAARVTGGLLPVAVLDCLADAAAVPPNCLPVWQPDGLPRDLMEAPVGHVDRRAGAAAALCIEAATRLAMTGEASALVTAPIHKEALAAAGVAYPGHTEMLQALAAAAVGRRSSTAIDGSALPSMLSSQSQSPPPPRSLPPLASPLPLLPLPPVRMMLANDELRTVLVTIHLSLRRAIEAVTFDAVLETLRISHRAAAAWGQARPRIGVAGLNPHAGEGGLFGDEEIRIIRPAIEAACAEGIDARGPYAPDTVFMRARNAPGHPGEFDIVVAMTHDHGLIPVKYLGVEQGVNVTLGLPFVRTSPDHGTAFDIAGSGRADASSLKAALRMARRMAAAR